MINRTREIAIDHFQPSARMASIRTTLFTVNPIRKPKPSAKRNKEFCRVVSGGDALVRALSLLSGKSLDWSIAVSKGCLSV